MHSRKIKALGMCQLQKLVAERTAARRRIGWFDHCSDSYDMREAMARAVRVYFRVQVGARLSLRECRDI
jgi:hypothetical protein